MRRKRGQSIQDGKKYCYKCKTEKEVETNFHRDRTVYGGFSKICKHCYTKSAKVENRKQKKCSDISFYLKTRCNQLRYKASKNAILFDLTPEYLLELFNSQNGRCYYTEEYLKIDNSIAKHDSLSVDRLTPDKGYTKGNVVLCTQAINSMKNDLTEEQFQNFLREKIRIYTRYLNRIDENTKMD